MEIEQIKKDKEIAKQEIVEAINKLISKHKNVIFEIVIENEVINCFDKKEERSYLVCIEAKI